MDFAEAHVFQTEAVKRNFLAQAQDVTRLFEVRLF